ncbi:MAG: LuxR C-terminal-related transcriptional regulator [Planctomycetota bacterium]|jgi:DNA-binding NarL/FixJ family response regulator
MSIRLLLADHHVAAVAGVKRFLDDTEIEVTAEAPDDERAVELAAATRPDVALLAIELPTKGGLTALGRIRQARPHLPAVVTACNNHPAFLAEAHRSGANGFLFKDFSRDKLVTTLRRVVAGEQTWSSEEVRRVAGVLATTRLSQAMEAPLTPREDEVLRHVIRGLTNRSIAEQLEISYETVKEHVQHIIHKLGVNDRTQAAVWAVRNGVG